MKADQFVTLLKNHSGYFVQQMGKAGISDGFKLSIQGVTLEDSRYLWENLIGFLVTSNCSFKFGTQVLIDCDHEEQRHKLLTIYIPNGVDVKSFAELVHLCIPDYTGGNEVKPPTSYEHYKGSIYFRNDRDEDGNYIKAN